MQDSEKVIKELHDTRQYLEDKEWSDRCASPHIDAINDALALLKERDAVKPKYNARTNWYECGACRYSMTSGMHCKSELIPAYKVGFCAKCGRKQEWE